LPITRASAAGVAAATQICRRTIFFKTAKWCAASFKHDRRITHCPAVTGVHGKNETPMERSALIHQSSCCAAPTRTSPQALSGVVIQEGGAIAAQRGIGDASASTPARIEELFHLWRVEDCQRDQNS